MNVLETFDLNFKYKHGGFGLKSISFGIKKGDFTALMGPNGAGKTTLVRILSGLLDDYSGEVMLDGTDMRKYSAIKKAALLSYIPQADNMAFDFKVEEIVAMGRRPYINERGALSANDREKIKLAMNYFGLYEKRSESYNFLSGGEKRLVLIARAIAQETGVIILDEPLTYLDIRNQSELMEHLMRLNEGGHTIVMISHGINLTAEYAKRIVVMKEGKIEADGRPAEVLTEKVMREVYGMNNFYIENNSRTGTPNLFMVPGNKKSGV
jgi:iron complex transport system ATP-binding protein